MPRRVSSHGVVRLDGERIPAVEGENCGDVTLLGCCRTAAPEPRSGEKWGSLSIYGGRLQPRASWRQRTPASLYGSLN